VSGRTGGMPAVQRTRTPTRLPVEIVVIGASLGGLEALGVLLAALPPEMPPIAVVLHRSADIGESLCSMLAERSALPVVEPDDKTSMARATVYLAPSDYHLLVERDRFALSSDPPVRFARPSIDVLLETAADAYGARCLAVLLTCASTDGVAGAAAVRRFGGPVLVQDPREARSPVLPGAVVDAGLATVVAPLGELRKELVRLCLE
jgi:two-component system chemotaxis response regulator CheB